MLLYLRRLSFQPAFSLSAWRQQMLISMHAHWRQVMAANGLSERVSVVHRDVALLQRGREVRPLGCNLALADLFDAGVPISLCCSALAWHDGCCS